MDDLTSFKSSFKGDIVTPSDPDYKAAINRWAINAVQPAKVVAFVKDAEDVALAIKYAKEANLPIAIKGGGHNASGSSSSADGLVIDLSRHLNGVDINPSKKLAIVQGGAIWATVDKAAIEHGLAAVAGTVNDTGVGGRTFAFRLTLGGGYGWLSAAHGLVIDNLVQVTIVTADGSILTANESENADLFWAIRGGGSNFGVCTEFVYKLHEQRRTVYAGMIIFPPPAIGEVIKAVRTWHENGPTDKEAFMMAVMRGPDGNPGICVLMFYNGSEAEGRENFKWLFDLKPVVDMTKEMPYEVLNTLLNEGNAGGKNAYTAAASWRTPSPDIFKAHFEKMVEVSADKTFQVLVIYELFNVAKVNSVPNDAMAFRSRGPQTNIIIISYWENNTPEKLARARSIAHDFVSIVTSSEIAPLENENSGYGNNECDPVLSEEKRLRLFGNNYPRLQQIKKKYDPNSVFNKWFPIVPA
ncbi:FAD-binding domain-containing protein [Rickenella mellea]|uniref:FAD-binding domain-containing protein n=1 Tax=Rickenella mellea TaxID=50990 RepID=A0A4R5XF33_9AGAM|nr:FAD-binding domain-containing protein [Rickenella mellea]